MRTVERPKPEGYYFDTRKGSGKRVQEASFDAWNINPSKHKLLRHLNPSQSCNGFRLYFGVSVRFNMIPFN